MSENSLGSVLFGAFAAGWWLYRRYSAVTVHSIMIYPIKSCKGIKVSSWFCDTSGTHLMLLCLFTSTNSLIITHNHSYQGLLFDRVYMLADKSLNYKFISQRKYPSMALITTEIDLVAGNLIVTAPGMILLVHLPTHSFPYSFPYSLTHSPSSKVCQH